MSEHPQPLSESPDPPWMPFGEALRDALRPIHDRHSTAEIRLPSASGAFPSEMWLSWHDRR